MLLSAPLHSALLILPRLNLSQRNPPCDRKCRPGRLIAVIFRPLFAAAALAVLAAGCADTAPPPSAAGQNAPAAPESLAVRFQESRFFRGHDMFPSADDPQVASVADATLEPDDEVLGFVVGNKARAYRVGELCYHHVVNDTIGEAPIVVTY